MSESNQTKILPNPMAPPEVADFGFAVGDWQYTTRACLPDGSTYDLPLGSWTFRYITEGWAIFDEFSQPFPDGTTLVGSAIRAYDVETKKWRIRAAVGGVPGWDDYEARRVGDTVVMTGRSCLGIGPDGPALQRVTFLEITPNSFSRRLDESLDDGVTWTEGVAESQATRV